MAAKPKVMGEILGIHNRVISRATRVDFLTSRANLIASKMLGTRRSPEFCGAYHWRDEPFFIYAAFSLSSDEYIIKIRF